MDKTKLEKYIKDGVGEECDDDFCDLNPDKICDNCGKCIDEDKNYKVIKITKIIKN